MPPDPHDPARREAESLQRQAQMMEQRRPEREEATRGALRRIVIVVVVLAVAIALWRAAT